ncbi:MFS-type transporter clz9-like [Haliotis rubra]|uniref:MFS-type transporter clz9-like n=1 Tax=Haliotis rubra TaxID=36100 RepID=UPI001EE602AD|nr:MFS-type transporter clz9-like [Haliotis rubra]
MSVRKAAKNFSVPFATLRDRTSGNIGMECLKSGPEPLLSIEEERNLVVHIQAMADFGFGYTRSEVADLATDLAIHLGKKSKTNKPLSMQWFYNFLSRWPDLKVQKPRSLELQRAKATSKETVGHYFKELGQMLDKYNLKDNPNRIYNIDEKGIVENHTPPSVVSSSQATPYAVTCPRSSTTTIIGCGSASGAVIPPYFVFKGKRMREENMTGSTPGAAGTVSDSGWSNSQIFRQYLEHHLLKNSVIASVDRPLLILYDGHRSHVSLSLITWAREHNIILFVLLAHTSHVLQPLDVCCFGPFSKIYNNLRHKFMRNNPTVAVAKHSVCELACKAYSLALTPSNLQSSFKTCGIYPFDNSTVSRINFAPSTVFHTPCEDADRSERVDNSNDKTTTSSVKNFLFSKQSVLTDKSQSTKKRKVLSAVVGGKAITEDSIMEKVREHQVSNPPVKKRKSANKTPKSRQNIMTDKSSSPQPGTSGIYFRRIDPVVDSSDEENEITDDELCCQCYRFTPRELEGCQSIVFVSWAECTHPSCKHWVHLKVCTPVRVVRATSEFWCPCHDEKEE